jgi:hypothetical protein
MRVARTGRVWLEINYTPNKISHYEYGQEYFETTHNRFGY